MVPPVVGRQWSLWSLSLCFVLFVCLKRKEEERRKKEEEEEEEEEGRGDKGGEKTIYPNSRSTAPGGPILFFLLQN